MKISPDEAIEKIQTGKDTWDLLPESTELSQLLELKDHILNRVQKEVKIVTGEFNNGTGWTLYPPLSTSLISLSPIGIDILLYGLLLSGISSCLTSINFIATIINMRCYSMTLSTYEHYLFKDFFRQ